MLERVGPFLAGDPVKAEWLQEMLDTLKALQNIRGLAPIRVNKSPLGVLISSIAEGGIDFSTPYFPGTLIGIGTAQHFTSTICGTLAISPGTWLVFGQVTFFVAYSDGSPSWLIGLAAGNATVGPTQSISSLILSYNALMPSSPREGIFALPTAVITVTGDTLFAQATQVGSAPSAQVGFYFSAVKIG